MKQSLDFDAFSQRKVLKLIQLSFSYFCYHQRQTLLKNISTIGLCVEVTLIRYDWIERKSWLCLIHILTIWNPVAKLQKNLHFKNNINSYTPSPH